MPLRWLSILLPSKGQDKQPSSPGCASGLMRLLAVRQSGSGHSSQAWRLAGKAESYIDGPCSLTVCISHDLYMYLSMLMSEAVWPAAWSCQALRGSPVQIAWWVMGKHRT